MAEVEVIMPALGMAQDTGKLVAWLKAPGDAVAAGDALFEVETDKSVMEVEAQVAGFLVDIGAAEGEDVPVGQVIARISDSAEGSGTAPVASGSAAPKEDPSEPSKPSEPPAPEPAAEAHAPGAKTATTPDPRGRILASPKARSMAAREGLDLSRLVSVGHPMPYHVADLQVLRDLPQDEALRETGPGTTGHAGAAPASTAALHQITARVPAAGVTEFLDWMVREGGVDIAPRALYASIAAGAFRSATRAERLALDLRVPGSDPRRLADPDLRRLSVDPAESAAAPDLILHDLTETPLTSIQLDAAVPALSLGRDGDGLVVTLVYRTAQMEDAAAIACVTDLAHRLVDPLQHLV